MPIDPSTLPDLTYCPIPLGQPVKDDSGYHRQDAQSDLGPVSIYWWPNRIDIYVRAATDLDAYREAHGGVLARADGRPALRYRYPS
jgi:hypothetical protein